MEIINRLEVNPMYLSDSGENELGILVETVKFGRFNLSLLFRDALSTVKKNPYRGRTLPLNSPASPYRGYRA